MPIPFKLDYVIEKTLAQNSESAARKLRQLTAVKLSEPEACAVWPRILDHKWYLGERLGRDVGLRVAAVDYFENIYQAPTIYHRRDTLPKRLRMMQPLMRTSRFVVG